MKDIIDKVSAPVIIYEIENSRFVKNKAAQALEYQEILNRTMDLMIRDDKDIGYDVIQFNGSEEIISSLKVHSLSIIIFLIHSIENMNSVLDQLNRSKMARNELDAILDSIHDDVLITDEKGVIIKVFPSFEEVYKIKRQDALGKTVFELEKRGVFKPSVVAKVLKSNSSVTMMQNNQEGRQIIVTATPIKDISGKIIKVISFSRDISDFLELKQQYEELEKTFQKYSAELLELRKKEKENFPSIISRSTKINHILETIDTVSEFDANILITGESGVGKTMFSRLIHSKSKRSQGPLIEINCGSIPENLLESELFGYEKGSFTGANEKGKVGLIELADKGTLFLDEVGELPFNLQVKLLKVIQDKSFTRVGGTKTIKVDFRLISATNKDLAKMVREGKYREDLYYRLNVILIHIPSLRERKEDLLQLSMYFLENFNTKYGINKSLSHALIEKFMYYHWPGNVRELENVIERMALTSKEEMITEENIPTNLKSTPSNFKNTSGSLQEAIESLERHMIVKAYSNCHTSVGVAKQLGISQSTAVRKIKKYIK